LWDLRRADYYQVSLFTT